MARMKFLCDAERCIECNACVTACKNEHEVPWGVNRRRVVTLNDGKPGERSISVACMHCSDAPCMAVCPVDCFYETEDGVVLHSKDLCIGCGYCFYACPFGAPQYPQASNFGSRGKMDKCTFCAGGPEADNPAAEFTQVRPQPSGGGQVAAVRGNVLHQGACWPAMATSGCRRSTANASSLVVSVPAPGVGARPTTRKTAAVPIDFEDRRGGRARPPFFDRARGCRENRCAPLRRASRPRRRFRRIGLSFETAAGEGARPLSETRSGDETCLV